MDDKFVHLHGVTCCSCGFLGIPRQSYGCEHCGAYGQSLLETQFAGLGTVLSAVTIHQHPHENVTTPLRFGAVQLDDGPVVRARLAAEIEAGRRVNASHMNDVLVFVEADTK